MKKRGFTLAEVLITLGIVGVVAALTAPALVMSSRNEANAARLSVVVSNLENAFNNAIVQEGADNLYRTSLWTNGALTGTSSAENVSAFVGNLGKYMIVNGFKQTVNAFMGDNRYHPMNNNGSTNSAVDTLTLPGQNGPCFTIETKSGAVIHIRTYAHTNAQIEAGKNAAIAAGSSYYTRAADVFIDVNGKSAPNTYGRDLFGFQVGENGVLYPLGGRDVGRIDSNDATNVWDTAGKNYSCTDANKGSSANTRGLGCTARVIAEGYKINY